MFKKLLQSLSRAPSTPSSPPSGPLPPKKSGPLPPKPSGILGRIAKGESGLPSVGSPEQMCQVTPGMSKEELSARLKMLYRRYNRSASSLNAETRAEAEKMLNAIVLVREKHFGAL